MCILVKKIVFLTAQVQDMTDMMSMAIMNKVICKLYKMISEVSDG